MCVSSRVQPVIIGNVRGGRQMLPDQDCKVRGGRQMLPDQDCKVEDQPGARARTSRETTMMTMTKVVICLVCCSERNPAALKKGHSMKKPGKPKVQ